MPKTLRFALSNWIRSRWLRRQGVRVYNGAVLSRVKFLGTAVIEPYCRLNGDPLITVGDNFYLNSGCHLLGNIRFGKNVLIGPKVVFWGRDHGIELGLPMNQQPHVRSDIFVGDDVWIGASAVVLKGVSIATGAVVGAGSIVTKDVPKNAVVAGSPARVIKYRE